MPSFGSHFGKFSRAAVTLSAGMAKEKLKKSAPVFIKRAKTHIIAGAVKAKDAALVGAGISVLEKTAREMHEGKSLFNAVKTAATDAILIGAITAALRTLPGGVEFAQIYEKILKDDKINKQESLKNLAHSAVKPKIKDAVKNFTGDAKAAEISHTITVKTLEQINPFLERIKK